MLIIQYLEKINILLDTYAPIRNIDKLRLESKPWITLDLQKLILVKNILFAKFINTKDPMLKKETRNEYKNYRNLLSALINKIF